jgi:hypothetical protein
MGMSKKNRFLIKQMMCKLRQDYPDQYYKTLTLCKRANISPAFKAYSLPELDPLANSVSKYLNILRDFQASEIPEIGSKWKHYYAKDSFTFNQIETFFKLGNDEMLRQLLTVNQDFGLKEISEPELKQSLIVEDTFDLGSVELPLENLEIVVLDLLKDGDKTMNQLTEDLLPYFDSDDYHKNKDVLTGYLSEKIKSLMAYGAIRWVDFKPIFSRPILTD